MTSTTLIPIFGTLAAIGLILGYLPQAIQTIRTRNTDGISLPGFLMMGLGSFCFVCQGILIGLSKGWDGAWALVTTNLVTTACALIIFGIKMYNDHFKK
mgnify:CR=1 FL=1